MKILKMFVKFGIVGVSGVVVNLAIYSTLVHFGVYYLAAATISFVGAVTNNFYWNFIWTFKGRAEHKTVKRKYFDFFVISFINFLINLSCLRFLHGILEIHEVVAQIMAIGLASLFNFIGNYLITFKEKQVEEETRRE